MSTDLTPLDILRRDGWTKGDGSNPPRGGLCILGACGVTGQPSPFVRALTEVVAEQFPERYDFSVALWNDHPATTFADVELVLEKAQLRYDEQITA